MLQSALLRMGMSHKQWAPLNGLEHLGPFLIFPCHALRCSYQRPFELATVRLFNMVYVLSKCGWHLLLALLL